jgi:DNA-binding MarR family transcriptional regulator
MSEWQPIHLKEVAAPTRAGPSPGRLQLLASDVLSERARRLRFFPQASFGEVSWDILLSLYVSPDPVMLKTLADQLGQSIEVTDRWISYLDKEGIATKTEGKSSAIYARVELTRKGRDSLTLYLTETMRRQNQRHCEYAPGAGSGFGFAPRAVTVLTLGTAIFSAALTWCFMSGYQTTGLLVTGAALCAGTLARICLWAMDNTADLHF